MKCICFLQDMVMRVSNERAQFRNWLNYIWKGHFRMQDAHSPIAHAFVDLAVWLWSLTWQEKMPKVFTSNFSIYDVAALFSRIKRGVPSPVTIIYPYIIMEPPPNLRISNPNQFVGESSQPICPYLSLNWCNV